MFVNFNNYKLEFEKMIESFGGVKRNNKKYVFRDNTNNIKSNEGGFFACVALDEAINGPYSDLSIVVFISNENQNDEDRWIVSLVVGSLGYKNDYQIVSLPGTRRMFLKAMQEYSNDTFIKNDFMDIESEDGLSGFINKRIDIPETLKNSIGNYGKLLLSSTVIDPNQQSKCTDIIKLYMALYAQLRNWPQSKKEREAIQKAKINSNVITINEKKEIEELLIQRKYIVLQGAPGTGKTRMAKELVKHIPGDRVFFTQFHAETTYSDFVWGIVPDTKASQLVYKDEEGIFVKAINKARSTGESVYLIIDEINRANLSNVLGTAFYLFEPTMADSNIKIEVCPTLTLDKLPDNLYVIATMNTADRSLAVVDFALRRRFAWYTLYPHVVRADQGKYFCEATFRNISDIFEKYATDEELNLQPGHAYFIVKESQDAQEINEAMKIRLRYEIMPLLKEYLIDGMLVRAKDDFIDLFRREIGEEMFR